MGQAISNNLPALLAFGLFIGVFAGLFGLGGGAILVPLLVLLFAKDQATAQGTSLAMILAPTAAPAILRYHQAGAVDWRMVLYVAPTMLVGSYFGAKLAVNLPQDVLRVGFAVVLTYIAAYMIFGKLPSQPRAMLWSLVPVLVVVGLVFASGVYRLVSLRTLGAEASPATPEVAD
jgi:uncharacterized membrane protein YfcA